jgi:hypothetical protein
MKQRKQVVYFVRSGELIKIGITSDHRGRINALKAANASPVSELGVIEGGSDLEQSLHERFGYCHSHGEWFFATPELLAYIQDTAVPYKEGMGKTETITRDYGYAGLTLPQMLVAGLLVT